MSYPPAIQVVGLNAWLDCGFVGTDLMPTPLRLLEHRERELEEMRVRALEERIVAARQREPRLVPPPLPWDREMEDELFPPPESTKPFGWVQALAS